jgi:hypothetical protein
MDIQASHLLSKLDRIERAQRHYGEMLRRILVALEAKPPPEPASPEPPKLPAGLILRGALMWTLGAAMLGYLAKGGDPLALIELLLKFSG